MTEGQRRIRIARAWTEYKRKLEAVPSSDVLYRSLERKAWHILQATLKELK